MMATDDEKRELSNGIILGVVLLIVVVFACWLCGALCRFSDFEPQPTPAEEHSVLKDSFA